MDDPRPFRFTETTYDEGHTPRQGPLVYLCTAREYFDEVDVRAATQADYDRMKAGSPSHVRVTYVRARDIATVERSNDHVTSVGVLTHELPSTNPYTFRRPINDHHITCTAEQHAKLMAAIGGES